MTSEADEQRRAAGIEIAELLATMSASDSVELKMTVVPDQHRTTIASLAIDPVEAQPRQVFFFDTPDLRLNQAGVVVRARRIQGGRGDTVVKLRPVVPDELPRSSAGRPSFNVEVDVLPGLIGVCSASLKGRASGAEIRDAVRGEIPLRKLFSKDQRAFYKEHAPADLELDALQVLGPTFILKSVFQATSMRPPIRRGGSGSTRTATRILELSTKCLPNEAVPVARRGPDVPRRPRHRASVPARSRRRPRRPSSSSAAHLRDGGADTSADIALGGEGDRRRWRGPAVERRRCRRR